MSKHDLAALSGLARNAKHYFARLLRYVFKRLDLHFACSIKALLPLFFLAALCELDFQHFLSLLNRPSRRSFRWCRNSPTDSLLLLNAKPQVR